jgi:hypothetical protein
MLPPRTSPTAKTPGRLVSERPRLDLAAQDNEERDRDLADLDEDLALLHRAPAPVNGDSPNLRLRQLRKQTFVSESRQHLAAS